MDHSRLQAPKATNANQSNTRQLPIPPHGTHIAWPTRCGPVSRAGRETRRWMAGAGPPSICRWQLGMLTTRNHRPESGVERPGRRCNARRRRVGLANTRIKVGKHEPSRVHSVLAAPSITTVVWLDSRETHAPGGFHCPLSTTMARPLEKPPSKPRAAGQHATVTCTSKTRSAPQAQE